MGFVVRIRLSMRVLIVKLKVLAKIGGTMTLIASTETHPTGGDVYVKGRQLFYTIFLGERHRFYIFFGMTTFLYIFWGYVNFST